MFLGNKYVSLTKESSIKYFCIQALGRAVLFYSGLLLFSNLFCSFSVLSIILGGIVKLGLFPFHFWVPNVIGGLSWFPIYIILTIQKVAPFAFFISIISFCREDIQFCVALLGGLTALVGGVLGNNQTDIRGILGYSSVAHRGWMFIGVLGGSFWLYFFVYCLRLGITFFFLENKKCKLERGIGLLSLRGLPPFLIFVGKWGVLKRGLEIGFPEWVITFFLLSSLFSLAFYLKFRYSFILNRTSSLKGSELRRLFGIFLLLNLSGLSLFYVV